MPAGRSWTRAPSLAAGLAISAVLMLYPYALGTDIPPLTHAALPILLLGVSGALVHGIGYRPDNRALRVLFGPLVSWLLMGIGGGLVVLAQAGGS
ncbi:MAG: cyd operon YbgE family protein [Bauldia sp.]